MSGDLADARAKAEEALAEAMTCLAGWGAEAILDVEKQLARQLGMLAAALRALLDALPQPRPSRPAQDAVRKAAERADKAMRDVFGGVDQFGDYCGHPVMPVKLAYAVQALLIALDAARGGAS